MAQDRILYRPREKRNFRTRSRLRALRPLAYVFGVFILLAGAVFFVRSSHWRIREIQVEGTESLEKGDIEKFVRGYTSGEYAFLFPKDSFFFLKADALSGEIMRAFPRIAHAEVVKKDTNGILVDIRERALWGVMCNGEKLIAESERKTASRTHTIAHENQNNEVIQSAGSCAYVDTEGFGYESAPRPAGNLLLKIKSDQDALPIPSQLIDSSLAKDMHFVQEKAPELAGVRITGFELLSRVPSEFHARTSEGFLILFKKNDDLAHAFSVLKKVLEREIGNRKTRLEYIDLRFGNKVFYKYK